MLASACFKQKKKNASELQRRFRLVSKICFWASALVSSCFKKKCFWAAALVSACFQKNAFELQRWFRLVSQNAFELQRWLRLVSKKRICLWASALASACFQTKCFWASALASAWFKKIAFEPQRSQTRRSGKATNAERVKRTSPNTHTNKRNQRTDDWTHKRKQTDEQTERTQLWTLAETQTHRWEIAMRKECTNANSQMNKVNKRKDERAHDCKHAYK